MQELKKYFDTIDRFNTICELMQKAWECRIENILNE